MTTAPRIVRHAILAGAALAASGCLVVALRPFYPESSIVLDDRVLGAWQNEDDNVSVTIERGEWRSYRVTYSYLSDTRTLTGYLFKAGDTTYIDLSPLRGEDPGMFLLPGHSVARLTFRDEDVLVDGLEADWFARAAAARTAPPELMTAQAEHGQVVLAAERSVLERWLAALPAQSPVWSDSAVFRRKKLD